METPPHSTHLPAHWRPTAPAQASHINSTSIARGHWGTTDLDHDAKLNSLNSTQRDLTTLTPPRTWDTTSLIGRHDSSELSTTLLTLLGRCIDACDPHRTKRDKQRRTITTRRRMGLSSSLPERITTQHELTELTRRLCANTLQLRPAGLVLHLFEHRGERVSRRITRSKQGLTTHTKRYKLRCAEA